MAKPIYQLFIINKNVSANRAMKGLSEAEQKSLWAKEQASRDAVGAKAILVCGSEWADEEHPAWGVVSFPDLKARMQQTRALRDVGWFDVMDAFTLLGTPEFEQEEVKMPDPIYKLWLVKSNPAVAQISETVPKGLNSLMEEKHNALHKEYNSQVLFFCSSTWSNEAYLGFGVSVFPNIEANMAIMKGLGELGWPRYYDVFSLLGTKYEG
jgi:hypothetical protein